LQSAERLLLALLRVVNVGHKVKPRDDDVGFVGTEASPKP